MKLRNLQLVIVAAGAEISGCCVSFGNFRVRISSCSWLKSDESLLQLKDASMEKEHVHGHVLIICFCGFPYSVPTKNPNMIFIDSCWKEKHLQKPKTHKASNLLLNFGWCQVDWQSGLAMAKPYEFMWVFPKIWENPKSSKKQNSDTELWKRTVLDLFDGWEGNPHKINVLGWFWYLVDLVEYNPP